MNKQIQTPRLLIAVGVFCILGGGPYAAGTSKARGQREARSERLYDGLTLDQWRDRIQRIDFQAADRGRHVQGLREIVRDESAPWFSRRQAALTLGRLGDPASAAIADLVGLLKTPAEPLETAPPLWALKALALFGPSAVMAAPDAIAVLKDVRQSMILRLTSTETLARIGIASADGIAVLIAGAGGQLPAASDSDQLELRIACIEALQLPAPPSAVPMLLVALDDDADRIRHAAAATAGFLGTRAEPAAESLGAMVVFDDVPVVRETAARSLARMGMAGRDVLVRLLRSGDDEVVLLAIDGASRVSSAGEIERALRDLFASPNRSVAARAMDAWWTVTRDPGPILKPLAGFLSDPERGVRKSSSDTLLRMGRVAAPLREDLELLVRTGEPGARVAAGRILRQIKSTGPAEQSAKPSGHP